MGSDRGLVRWPFHRTSISIHAPRVGSDAAAEYGVPIIDGFLSTLPAWGATVWPLGVINGLLISIHAPRVGSDLLADAGMGKTERISIHAPRVGSDFWCGHYFCSHCSFLSTLPAWGATGSCPRSPCTGYHFYPRSPRGERPDAALRELPEKQISIHAPRVGSDSPAAAA